VWCLRSCKALLNGKVAVAVAVAVVVVVVVAVAPAAAAMAHMHAPAVVCKLEACLLDGGQGQAALQARHDQQASRCTRQLRVWLHYTQPLQLLRKNQVVLQAKAASACR
jgi:hypothetical protein